MFSRDSSEVRASRSRQTDLSILASVFCSFAIDFSRQAGHSQVLRALALVFFSLLAGAQLSAAPLQGASMVPADLEYLEDPGQSIPFERVQDLRFTPVPSAKPSFGYSSSVYWLRFSLESEGQSEVWIELVSLIDSIEMSSSVPVRRHCPLSTGRMEPLGTRPVAHRNFVFPLTLEEGRTSVYFRFRSSGSMLFPITVWSREGFREKDYVEQVVFGLYLGILLALAMYNIFLFLSVRDASYIYYVLYVVSFAVFQAAVWGVLHELFPDSPVLATQLLPASIGAAILFVSGFALEFLRIELGVRRIFLRALQVLGGMISVLAFTAPYRIAAQGGVILGIAAVVTLTVVSISVVRSFKPARYFILAFAALLVGVEVIALRNLGVLPFRFLTSYSGQIGSVMEIMQCFLSLWQTGLTRSRAKKREHSLRPWKCSEA